MKVTSIAGAATTTRTATLHLLTQTGAAATPLASPVMRPVALAPPPRASSFGGADPRTMFEALVQSFDTNGDGKLSLDEVNALNQGGLLSRSFARIDSNADGAISGDEVATRTPWGGAMPPSGGQTGDPRADVRPLFDKRTDHLTANRDAAISGENRAAARPSSGAVGFDPQAIATLLSRLDPSPAGMTAAPATMMESMVLAMFPTLNDETEADLPDAIKQTDTLR